MAKVNTAMKIKHMAFAVNSVDKSLRNFQSFLNVSQKTEKVIWEKAKTKVAVFFIGGIEFQLCESIEKDGKFNKFLAKNIDKKTLKISFKKNRQKKTKSKKRNKKGQLAKIK